MSQRKLDFLLGKQRLNIMQTGINEIFVSISKMLTLFYFVDDDLDLDDLDLDDDMGSIDSELNYDL